MAQDLKIGDTIVSLTASPHVNGEKRSGETIIVAIKENGVTDSFLDFNDDTFKTSGWTTRTQTLVEDSTESGLYEYIWDSSGSVTTEKSVTAIYTATIDSTDLLAQERIDFTFNQASDQTAIRDAILDRVLAGNHDTSGTTGEQVQLIRKVLTNRLELDNGGTGNLILYDDDNSVLLTFDQKDVDGNDISVQAGAPMRRTKGA